MIPLLLSIVALISYGLGAINSPMFIANLIFKEDLRALGRRNASFENFLLVYGRGWSMAVIAFNIIKTLIPALLSLLLMKIPGDGFGPVAMLFAGFCVVLGDCYPFRFRFRGAGGFTPCITALCLADWRAGLVAVLLYVVVIAFTRLPALAGMAAALSGCLCCWAFVSSEQMKGLCGLLALFMALVILFRQRKNFVGLFSGEETPMHWGRQADEKMREDRF